VHPYIHVHPYTYVGAGASKSVVLCSATLQKALQAKTSGTPVLRGADEDKGLKTSSPSVLRRADEEKGRKSSSTSVLRGVDEEKGRMADGQIRAAAV
jgi:hypothetical protein